ncbi:acyltransferase family protein [Enterobacter ludwigii]|uniref:acyltransferase family protein n=1 Tax=Enterobacter ludwigii TaxID=299767 RepID=UPI0030760C36
MTNIMSVHLNDKNPSIDVTLVFFINFIAKMSKLYSIQVLRGLAAVAVVIDHVTHYMHKSFSGESWIYSSNIYNVGGFGVDLFFCISGFIMVITTYNKPSGMTESISFLNKRFTRIYPTYWFYCILTLALPFILYGKTDLLSKYSATFLTQSFLLLPAKIAENSFSPFLGQGWTLQYELYFYIVFALSMLAVSGWKVIALSSFIILFMLASSSFTYPNEYINYLISNPIVVDFVLGMIVAQVYLTLKQRGVALQVKTIILILVSLLSLVSLLVMERTQVSRVVLFGVPSSLIVLAFSLCEINNKGFLSKILIQSGEASYTIYLAHMAFIWFAIKNAHYLEGINPDVSIFICSIAICLASYIMYLAVEKQITNYLVSFRRKRRKLAS